MWDDINFAENILHFITTGVEEAPEVTSWSIGWDTQTSKFQWAGLRKVHKVGIHTIVDVDRSIASGAFFIRHPA